MRTLRPSFVPFLALLAACGGEAPARPAPASTPSLLASALAPTEPVPGAEGAAAPSATPPPPAPADLAASAPVSAPAASAPELAPSRLGPAADARAGDPACLSARAALDKARARAQAARSTAGVAEKRALSRAETLLAACESSQRCVEEEPEERAKRYEAVMKAREAVGTAQRGLQLVEVAVFEADRAASAACGPGGR